MPLPEPAQLLVITHERQFFQLLVNIEKLAGQQGLIVRLNSAPRSQQWSTARLSLAATGKPKTRATTLSAIGKSSKSELIAKICSRSCSAPKGRTYATCHWMNSQS